MIHHYTPKNNFRYSLSLGVWSGHEIPQDHRIFCGWNIHMDVFPKMGKYPQITPIVMGCSIQNHPFHGTFQMFPQHPRVIYHVFLVKLRLSLADGGGAHPTTSGSNMARTFWGFPMGKYVDQKHWDFMENNVYTIRNTGNM